MYALFVNGSVSETKLQSAKIVYSKWFEYFFKSLEA
jgi:hypothetical protein